MKAVNAIVFQRRIWKIENRLRNNIDLLQVGFCRHTRLIYCVNSKFLHEFCGWNIADPYLEFGNGTLFPRCLQLLRLIPNARYQCTLQVYIYCKSYRSTSANRTLQCSSWLWWCYVFVFGSDCRIIYSCKLHWEFVFQMSLTKVMHRLFKTLSFKFQPTRNFTCRNKTNNNADKTNFGPCDVGRQYYGRCTLLETHNTKRTFAVSNLRCKKYRSHWNTTVIQTVSVLIALYHHCVFEVRSNFGFLTPENYIKFVCLEHFKHNENFLHGISTERHSVCAPFLTLLEF